MNSPVSQDCDSVGVERAPARRGGVWLSNMGLSRASIGQRLIAAAVALAAWGVLGLAAVLTPDNRGYGTHEQLHLPQCHFKVISGYPCPTCGMTTAFSAFVHGNLAAALRAHVLGTVLAAGTLLAALGGTAMAATGIDLGRVVSRLFVGRTWWFFVLVGLAAGSWALKAATGW